MFADEVSPAEINGNRETGTRMEYGGSIAGELSATIGTAALSLAQGGELLEQCACGATV
jgi:hypothetical protein